MWLDHSVLPKHNSTSSPLSLLDSREDYRGNGTRVISCDPTGTSCVDPIGVAGEWVRVGSDRTDVLQVGAL